MQGRQGMAAATSSPVPRSGASALSQPVTSATPAAVPVAANICSAAPLPRRVRVRGGRQEPGPAPPGPLLALTLMRGDGRTGGTGHRRASERRCPRHGPATPRVSGARRSGRVLGDTDSPATTGVRTGHLHPSSSSLFPRLAPHARAADRTGRAPRADFVLGG